MTIKQTNRSLFLAMQADAKDFPGGIRAVAEFIGRNGNTLGNQLNPDHDAAPPSLEVFVELVKLCQGKRSAFAVAQLVNQVPMDVDVDRHPSSDSVPLFMTLLHEASAAFSSGSEFAKDLRFDAEERKKMEPLLMNLLKATAELLKTVRG